MARVNFDILGISELKWTGMGEFNSDDHYIYYYGQESLDSLTRLGNSARLAQLPVLLPLLLLPHAFNPLKFSLFLLKDYRVSKKLFVTFSMGSPASSLAQGTLLALSKCFLNK